MALEFVIVMTIAGLVFWFVLWPLRGPAPQSEGPDARLLIERDRIALAKDRKLDEIRELRGDRESGKLSAADAGPLERALRAQAADLLHQLDAIEAELEPVGDAAPAESAAEPQARPLP